MTNVSNFTVSGNWLFENGKEVEEVSSPIKKVSNGKNICDFIIIHYTASATASSAHNNFQNPETKVSWHLTVDRTGDVKQLYDFRKITWHAGKSSWQAQNGRVWGEMNPVSIGIELVNAGPLNEKHGMYYTWSGQIIPNSDVWFDANGNPWHAFTQVQLQTVWNICSALSRQYNCLDILGHNQISVGRKTDPGPAAQDFMIQLRTALRNGSL